MNYIDEIYKTNTNSFLYCTFADLMFDKNPLINIFDNREKASNHVNCSNYLVLQVMNSTPNVTYLLGFCIGFVFVGYIPGLGYQYRQRIAVTAVIDSDGSSDGMISKSMSNHFNSTIRLSIHAKAVRQKTRGMSRYQRSISYTSFNGTVHYRDTNAHTNIYQVFPLH